MKNIRKQLAKQGIRLQANGQAVVAMQEFPPAVIKKLAHLTDINNHTEARVLVAKTMGDKKLLAAYQAIETLHMYFGHLAHGLSDARYAIDKTMFAHVKAHYSNGQEVYMSF